MGLLSTLVIAQYDKKAADELKKRAAKPGPYISGSMISSCHYSNYVTYHKLIPPDLEGHNLMLMEDGHWQEEKILQDHLLPVCNIKHHGRGNQLRLTIGKAKTTGMPDGIIEVTPPKWHVLEIKGVSSERAGKLRKLGLRIAEPGIYCQVQVYMASDQLRDNYEGCWVYCLDKSPNRPQDFYVEKDLTWSKEIIQGLDSIRLENWEPKKELTPKCAHCYKQEWCWSSYVLDLSRLNYSTNLDIADKWIDASLRKTQAKIQLEETRELLIEEGLLGGAEYAVVQGSEAQITINRSSTKTPHISIAKFIEVFGKEKLLEVIEFRDSTRTILKLKE